MLLNYYHIHHSIVTKFCPKGIYVNWFEIRHHQWVSILFTASNPYILVTVSWKRHLAISVKSCNCWSRSGRRKVIGGRWKQFTRRPDRRCCCRHCYRTCRSAMYKHWPDWTSFATSAINNRPALSSSSRSAPSWPDRSSTRYNIPSVEDVVDELSELQRSLYSLCCGW